MHVSQPPLSRQIRDLEDFLGVALFHRGAKSVRLTEAGRAFLTEARAVLQRAEEAVQMAKAVAGGQRGEIGVGYAPSLTVEILPRALRSFQESNPGIRVQLHDLSTQGMLKALREEKLDVALMIQPCAEELSGLVFEELRRYAVCLAAHPAHPLARVRKVSLARVAGERLITYTISDYPEYHAWLASLFTPLGHPPQIAEEHDSATSLIASVEAGRGVALVQEGFECMAGRRLKVRKLSPAPAPFIVGMVHRRNGQSAITRDFLKSARCVKKSENVTE